MTNASVPRPRSPRYLFRANIRTAVTESLERLQSDYIDLSYAHADDPDTPLEETLGAFDGLVREGKVRQIAASNYSAPRLAEALEISERNGLARYVAPQPHYSLVDREVPGGRARGRRSRRARPDRRDAPDDGGSRGARLGARAASCRRANRQRA
jgi:aryl-alcohol dehydrogenase-like predicted oxidoreductase